jgi:uncharacterized protein (TIGR02996 family)
MSPPTDPLRAALEAAILANPNDRLSHAAYADYLIEHGDPQGEFIQVQLALEKPSLPAAERKKLQQREETLLAAHQAEWVGDWAALAPYGGPEGRGQLDFPEPRPARFVRGLLAEVVVAELTVNCVRALARAPQARLVRNLAIGGFAYDDEYEPGPDVPEIQRDEDASPYALLHLPQLANLRSFQLGWTSDEEYGDWCHFECHLDGFVAHEVVQKAPHLEELYLFAHGVEAHQLFALPLPELRILQVYHTWDYPLEILADNPSLARLTHLLCHSHVPEDVMPITLEGLSAVVASPHLTSLTHLRLRLTVFGDEGIERIIASGILGRLKVLDLRHGRVSDEGARALARCPEARRLELLDLSRNELTEDGIRALAEAGIRARTEFQHESTAQANPNELSWLQFLNDGDYE